MNAQYVYLVLRVIMLLSSEYSNIIISDGYS